MAFDCSLPLMQSCPSLRPAAWASIDLGYTASVGSVTVLAGPVTPAGTLARIYVTGPEMEMNEDSLCGSDFQLQPGGWVAAACNVTVLLAR